MEFIKMWVLRYHMASIFKEAEYHADRDLPKGSQVYLDLLAKTGYYIAKSGLKRNWAEEFPGLEDLRLLTIPEPEITTGARIVTVVAIASLIGFSIGTFSFIVGATYHMWESTFHLIGL